MDEAMHRKWWPLNVKHAKGETLTPEELAVYEAGRAQLCADENLDGDVEELNLLRTHISEMEARLAHMMEEYQALKARAGTAEGQSDRQQIGVSR
jgi:hypothetical protein